MEIINGSITYSHLLLDPSAQKSRNGTFIKGKINKESYLICYVLHLFLPLLLFFFNLLCWKF